MNLAVRAWLLGVVAVCHPKAHDAVLRGCLGKGLLGAHPTRAHQKVRQDLQKDF
ncbi:MAG: hypothetical protein WCJ99_14350 [Betaproteobacteria bacterium]|jgi:hypothetical protein